MGHWNDDLVTSFHLYGCFSQIKCLKSWNFLSKRLSEKVKRHRWNGLKIMNGTMGDICEWRRVKDKCIFTPHYLISNLRAVRWRKSRLNFWKFQFPILWFFKKCWNLKKSYDSFKLFSIFEVRFRGFSQMMKTGGS